MKRNIVTDEKQFNKIDISKTTPNKPTKAFSLIELLIVVAIIGILASALIFSLSDSTSSATVAVIRSDLKNITTSAALYHIKNNSSFKDFCENTDEKKGLGAKNTFDKWKDKPTTNASCSSDFTGWAVAIAILDGAAGGAGGDDRVQIYCIDSTSQNVIRKGGPKGTEAKKDLMDTTKSYLKVGAYGSSAHKCIK